MCSAVTSRIETFLFTEGIMEKTMKQTKKARTGKKFPIGPMTRTRKTYYKSTK